MRGPKVLVLWRIAARWLLPGGFRREQGEEMERTFAALAREARERGGRAGELGALGREVLDLARVGVRLRARAGIGSAARGETGARWNRATSGLAGDVRLGWRSLARRPGYALLAGVTLALGAGGGTALFALVKGVALDPLDYPEPDRLAQVFLTHPDLGFERGPVSGPDFAAWRERARPFRSLSAYQPGQRRTVRIDGEAHLVEGARVSGEFFETLAVAPVEGRWLRRSDEGGEAEPVVVLSRDLRSRIFGDGPAVGRRVELDGDPHTVVGVMPSSFLPLRREHRFWTPLPRDPAGLEAGQSFLGVIGRLRDGVEPAAAQRAVEALVREAARTRPGLEGREARVEPHSDVVAAGARRPLMLLLGALSLLLVIAAANLAGLALARGETRRGELALRRALGAGRMALARQLTVEGVVVAAVGGLLAVPVARWGLELLLRLAPADLPRLASVGLDAGSVTFGGLVAAGLTAAFTLGPALTQIPGDVARGLRSGRSVTGVSRLQRILVVGQVALALVLLTGAGLLGTSLARLASVDRGFDGRGVLTFLLQPPAGAYEEAEELDAMYDRVVASLSALPGVEAVGATWALPFGEMFGSSTYGLEDRPDSEEYLLSLIPVRGDYFGAMGITPVRGRLFRPGDGEDGRHVTVVNETFAERAWPGRDPVGQRLRRGSGEDARHVEVVGVVPDVTSAALAEESLLQAFWPHAAAPWARSLYFTVRTAGEPMELVPAARRAVARVDERMPLADVATMSGRFREHLSAATFRTAVVTAFALLASVLILLGVYGVTALLVVRRTREIGVRMALGAARRGVLLEVLGEGGRLALQGIVVGLAVAVASAGVLDGLLFGVEPLDPLLYAVAVGAVLLVTLAASWVPARRAGSVDPLEALRAE